MTPPKSQVRNVVSEVAGKGVCIGCGVCAGVCPNSSLSIRFNRYGEYNPYENGSCVDKCDACLNVCPFSEDSKDEGRIADGKFSVQAGIRHDEYTGYYLQPYIGYSAVEGHRRNGASGGIGTWILEKMLTSGMADFVVCVSPADEPGKLFAYRITDSVNDIRSSAKSVYYPVELSSAIRHMLKTEGRYAVVGLPCALKGLELARERSRRLRGRVVATIGLTCGQMKSANYTQFLAGLAGVSNNLKDVTYRSKEGTASAADFKFICTDSEGNRGELSFQRDVNEIWTGRWFTPGACNFCDDVFAEVADVALMDAWLDGYMNDNKGTNIVLARDGRIRDLLERGMLDEELCLTSTPIDNVIKSQTAAINVKRNHIRYRLYKRNQDKDRAITKRVAMSRDIGLIDRLEVLAKDSLQKDSREHFTEFVKGDRVDTAGFYLKMRDCIRGYRRWKLLMRLHSRAVRVFKG